MSDIKIHLDPAVAAAKRMITIMSSPDERMTGPEFNDDIVTMAVLILRLAGYQITDMTGEGHPNSTPVET